MIALLLCCALPAAIRWSSSVAAENQPGVAAALAEGEEVELAHVTYDELATRPRDFLHRPVKLTIQFHSRPETWNPFLTRFGPHEFIALQAWSDEQLLWKRAEFETPRVRLFARRGAAIDEIVTGARQYQRFELVVVVRELLAGRPWIEAVSVRPLEEHFDEGTLIHTSRASRLMESGEWALAVVELGRAQSGPLPDHVKAELQVLTELCLAGADGRVTTAETPPLGDVERPAPDLEELRARYEASRD